MESKSIPFAGRFRKQVLLLFFFSFLFFAFVMWCAPYSSDDLEFASLNYATLGEYLTYVLQYGNGRLLGNICAILMVKFPAFCILGKALVLSSCVILFPYVLGLDNISDYLLSFLLVAALDASVFGEVYVWTSGFCNYVPPIWLSLLIVCLIQHYPDLRSLPLRMLTCVGIFVLGVSSELFMEHSSGVNVLLALCFFLTFVKDRKKRSATVSGVWLAATVIGLTIMLLIPKVFYIEDNHSVTYRYTYLSSLTSIITSCVRNAIHLGSHYFGVNSLPICFGAIASVYLTRNWRSQRANAIMLGISVVSLLYMVLGLMHSVDGYLGKSALLQHSVSFVFVLLPLGVWVFAACQIDNSSLRKQVLFCLAFALISVLPLLVVSPIPVRVIYQSYVFVLMAALLCFAQIRQRFCTKTDSYVKSTFVGVSLLLVLMVGTVFTCVHSMSEAREQHIMKEISGGATEIEIFQLPYAYTTWDHLWSQTMYYNSVAERPVKLGVIEFDDWMNKYYFMFNNEAP